jgi:hypothetical protein
VNTPILRLTSPDVCEVVAFVRPQRMGVATRVADFGGSANGSRGRPRYLAWPAIDLHQRLHGSRDRSTLPDYGGRMVDAVCPALGSALLIASLHLAGNYGPRRCHSLMNHESDNDSRDTDSRGDDASPNAATRKSCVFNRYL